MSSNNSFELSLASETKDENLCADSDYLKESYGDDIFQRLLNNLFNRTFDQQEAAEFWRQAMLSFAEDGKRMNWRSVILDYLLTRTDLISNPRIIDAAELYRLQQDAVTDGLTNLYNQSHFKQRLAAVIQDHEERGHAPFSLILLDLDYFKQFNDRCGHLRGDHALEKIGKLICSLLPESGMAARYGGEEFAVILPDTELPQAIELADQIRIKVEEAYFEGEDRLDCGKLTISGGVACYPAAGKTSVSLISQADNKLYDAKVTRNSIAPRMSSTRHITRHNFRSIVEIFDTSSGDFKNALSSDISYKGILLKSSAPEEIGSNLKLRFPYPFWPTDHYTSGVVRHVRKSGHRGAFMVGVEFQQPQTDFIEGILPNEVSLPAT